jgi:hypothetical protein
MATTTTNFGWDIPQSTDLVKDGATAIATLGQDIDTALVGLKGGTTGQVLSKTSATDLAYTWVAQDDSNAIQNAIVDAKGDLIAATAADTPARLAVGTNGQILTADSTAATGLAWATAATSGGMTVIASGSIANSPTGFSITTIPTTYNNLQLVIRNSNSGANNINSRLRFNNLGTSIYAVMQNYGQGATAGAYTEATGGSIVLDNNNSSRGTDTSTYVVNLWDYDGNSIKTGSFTSYHQVSNGADYEILTGSFGVRLTSAIDRIDFITGNANSFSAAGTYTLYGVK